MRRRKKPGALEKYLTYTDYIIEAESAEEIANKVIEFVGERDFELELGSGATGFLIQHAINNPNKAYLAIEFKEELLLKAAKIIEEKNLSNIRLLNRRIEDLEPLFEELELSKIYLNFSDPWPKKRHTKRRLTSPKYLDLYKKILKKDGIIEFKTDNSDMFEYSVEQFEESCFEITDITRDLHNDKDKDKIIMTEYEKKYSAAGQKIKYVSVKLK